MLTVTLSSIRRGTDCSTVESLSLHETLKQ